MAESKSTELAKRRGPYKYLVCRIDAGHLVPLTSNGEDASVEWPPNLIVAPSPSKAREHVFAKLTEKQPAEARDAFEIDLVAIRDDNLGFQRMAWNVTREVAK